MRFSILIPHYKTGKMTAYCIHKLLKHRGRHELSIIVIDNSNDGSEKYFLNTIDGATRNADCANFGDHPGCDMWYIPYPKDLMQSHGIAFDYALSDLGDKISEYFITVESDSFPTQDNWLDYYESLINQGYDMVGSKMKLSGGEYIHPAGAMYKKSNWKEAKEFVKTLNEHYHYYPNLGMKDGFPCHIMSRERLTDFPDKHHSYNNVSFEDQLNSYLPIAQSVFHNGMGFKQESYLTYGHRNIAGEKTSIWGNQENTIYRMGYEPGQWFSYWHYATGKKVGEIPTQIHWMPNRVNQQQEQTVMENGFTHLWAVTAYHDCTDPAVADIAKRKSELMNQLYESIK